MTLAGILHTALILSPLNAAVTVDPLEIDGGNSYTFKTTYNNPSGSAHTSRSAGILAYADEIGTAVTYSNGTSEGYVIAQNATDVVIKFDFTNTSYQATGFNFEAGFGKSGAADKSVSLSYYYKLSEAGSWVHIDGADKSGTSFPGWPSLSTGVVSSFAASQEVYFKVAFTVESGAGLRWAYENPNAFAGGSAGALLGKGNGFGIQFDLAAVPEPATGAMFLGILTLLISFVIWRHNNQRHL